MLEPVGTNLSLSGWCGWFYATLLLYSIVNMDSFCKRYAVVLLLILTQNCAIADAENVTREQPSLAKVLTSYLKVPWINLNSSWTDEVTSNCRNDISMLYEGADAGEMWALRMLDSSSKIPAGILIGNIRDLGMYDQCVRVKAHQNRANIQGRHCMVSLSMPTKFVEHPSETLQIQKISVYNPSADVDFSLTASVCLPSSCDVQDVTSFVNVSLQSSPELAVFEVNVAQVTCSNIETANDLTPGQILVIVFFGAVLGILLFCTACDFVIRARGKSDYTSPSLKIAAKFSLYTNAIALASTKTGPETMTAIHGIRFLNTCLIVFGHRILTILIKPLVNPTRLLEDRQSILADFLLTMPYVVDTFFIVSGFLLTHSFLKALGAGKKINIFVLYLHRYLRLTPSLAVLLLFSIFILPSLGSGPMWGTVMGIGNDFCRKNWWANLLYVHNLVSAKEMCLPHTWYSSVEMQLFCLSPIILYPLFYRPKLGLTMLSLLSIVGLIVPAVQLAVNQWAVLFNNHKPLMVMYHEILSSYILTHNRILPYLIGIFLGYDVVNNKRRLTKGQCVCNWILAGIFILLSSGMSHFIQPNAPDFNVTWEVLYVSVGRLTWSIAMAWVLYACTQGYGGFLTRLLSLPIFVPLSRLSYAIYLVHFVVQVSGNATDRFAVYITDFGIIYLLWGDVAVSIVISFFLILCFESPVIVLEKMLRTKNDSPITNRDSTKENGKLSDKMKEYLDRTSGRVSSDLAIERTMLRQNLRRTVSEVLKTSLLSGSTRTPAEWAKACQDLKSYVLKNGTSVEDIQNTSVQSEIGKRTLDEELMIFLAGVSCGLDETRRVTESELMAAKFQSDSCDWQNEDHLGQIMKPTNAGIMENEFKRQSFRLRRNIL